jgi:hypothetical protein
MTVFLYHIKRKIELTLRENRVNNNWNLPMDNNEFRVFRDVKNAIEFVVRDTDRKPINLMGKNLFITIYDFRTGKFVDKMALEVMDEAKGICRMVFQPEFMEGWFLQTYAYQISVMDPDLSERLLYVDANESHQGIFELTQGPVFEPSGTFAITADQLTSVIERPNDVVTSYLYSGAIPGSNQTNNASGVHTVVAYLDNFTGTFSIQGSLAEESPDDGEWYEIETHTYNHNTSTQGYTFEANLNWLRVKVYNQYDQNDYGQPPLEADLGSVTKITFRT